MDSSSLNAAQNQHRKSAVQELAFLLQQHMLESKAASSGCCCSPQQAVMFTNGFHCLLLLQTFQDPASSSHLRNSCLHKRMLSAVLESEDEGQEEEGNDVSTQEKQQQQQQQRQCGEAAASAKPSLCGDDEQDATAIVSNINSCALTKSSSSGSSHSSRFSSSSSGSSNGSNNGSSTTQGHEPHVKAGKQVSPSNSKTVVGDERKVKSKTTKKASDAKRVGKSSSNSSSKDSAGKKRTSPAASKKGGHSGNTGVAAKQQTKATKAAAMDCVDGLDEQAVNVVIANDDAATAAGCCSNAISTELPAEQRQLQDSHGDYTAGSQRHSDSQAAASTSCSSSGFSRHGGTAGEHLHSANGSAGAAGPCVQSVGVSEDEWQAANQAREADLLQQQQRHQQQVSTLGNSGKQVHVLEAEAYSCHT